MKVLILGVAAVQMDAILQLNELGCETYVCAMAKDGPAADVADHFEIINIVDEEALTVYIQKHGIAVVYSVGSDIAMPVACKLSERLGLPCFVASNVAEICNHKNTMRKALTNECKGNVPYQVMKKPKKINISFPCILKPSDAQGQRGIFLLNSQEELEKHFEDARNHSREGKIIIEKYIDGPELSVNCYMLDGEIKVLIVSNRETWPEYTGLIHKHIVSDDVVDSTIKTRIYEIIKDACTRIGITNGPAYFQIKLNNKMPYIIEMTPRLDGCHMWNLLKRATGVNLLKLTFEHLLYNNTSELNSMREKIIPMELVFFCQKPNSKMNKDAFIIPNDAVDSFFYYEDGDYIRPVNGRYDKVGYYIRNY